MKLLGFHFYRVGSDGIPISHRQTANASESHAPTGTAALGTGTAESDRNLNARRGRFDRMKFLMITREKYRPPVPPAPPTLPALPALPDEPTFTTMISTALPELSNLIERSAEDIGPGGIPAPERRFRDTSTQYNVNDTVAPQLSTFRNTAVQYEAVPPKPFHFYNLPLELQRRILRYTHPADIKRFRLVSQYASLTGARELKCLNVNNIDSLEVALDKFKSGGIKSLTLSGPLFSRVNFNHEKWHNLMRSAFTTLETFDVSNCTGLTLNNIMTAVEHMPEIQEVKLPKGMASLMLPRCLSARVDDHYASRMEGLLRKVKQLDFIGASMLSGAGLVQSMSLLPELTHLHLSALTYLNDAALGDLLHGASNITHLHLHDCTELTPDGLFTALSRAPTLTHLDLSEPTGDALHLINGEELNSMLRATPQLTELVLKNCSEIESQDLITALPNVSANLVSLNLSNNEQLDGPHLAQILAQVPNLQVLDLSGVVHIDDASLNAALQHVPLLQDLTLNSSQLTDAGLTAALQHVPSLINLDISNCSRLRHVTLPVLSSLSTLKVVEAENLEDIALDNLPSLETLDISDNLMLNKEAIDNSLQHVRKTLLKLDISGLDLNDAQMPDLHKFLNLQQLDLTSNPLLTDVALRDLPVLDVLYVGNCPGLTDAALATVKANQVIR